MASGTVTLNSAVDTNDAFRMLVEYLYLLNYDPPGEVGRDDICLLHTRVYVLAERLCMENLKSLALQKMISELARPETYLRKAKRARLSAQTVVQLVEIVYENTPDLHAQSDDDRKSIASMGQTSVTDGPSREALANTEPSDIAVVVDNGFHGK